MSIEDELAKARLALELERRKNRRQNTDISTEPAQTVKGVLPISREVSDEVPLLNLIDQAYQLQLSVHNLIPTIDILTSKLLEITAKFTPKESPATNNSHLLTSAVSHEKEETAEFRAVMKELSDRYVIVGNRCNGIQNDSSTLSFEETRVLRQLLALVAPTESQSTLLKDKYDTLLRFVSAEELEWLKDLTQYLFKIIRMTKLLKKLMSQVPPN